MCADMAGGPLLDLGTYLVAIRHQDFGVARDGAGLRAAGAERRQRPGLDHPVPRRRRASLLHTTLFSHTPCQAIVAGSRGTLSLPGIFYAPGDFTMTANDGATQLHFREEANRYEQLYHEAIYFAYCVEHGSTELPVRPLLGLIATLETIDEVRGSSSVVFDEERTDPALQRRG